MTYRDRFARRLLFAAGLTALLVVAPTTIAGAQAPGLPRSYDAQAIDSPDPVGGGAFGWGIYSSDLTGDGKHDLLVAQSQVGTAEDPNRIFIFDGVTGRHIDTIAPPEDNPPTATGAYDSPELGFVYVETMPDLGSCASGDGPDADKLCDASVVGPGDGIPEILVGARALRVDPVNGASAPDLTDVKIGRGYVIDGATRAVLKRIDMPQADRMLQQARNAGNAFARTMSSPQGLPPCAGSRAENNDTGVGPCPSLSDPRYPRAVRIGDLNGGGQPDIVITARGYSESRGAAGSAAPGSQCQTTTTTGNCGGVGKVWVYAGEDIVGSNPRAILETPMYTPSASLPNGGIRNPDAQIGGGEFGGNMFRVGDITGPSAAGPATGQPDLRLPDGIPDFVIPARGHDVPLKNPDPDAGLNVGAAYLFSGANGALIRTIVSPEPQIRAQFSGSFNAGRAVGDLGATTTPDLLLPAALHNAFSSDDGKLWVFNGDTTAGGGGEQSFNFASLTDPEPAVGGNFGGAQTGVGNLVSGPANPGNEVLIGGFRFDTFTEASENNVSNLNFINAQTERNLMTVPHPTGARGDGLGVGITPMGDINGDGFLDFSASAYLANAGAGGSGRAYIFRSNNTPPPPPPAVAPPPAAMPAAPSAPPVAAALRAGPCVNQKIGTAKADKIAGTIAGDRIFGLGAADAISGFQGQDCLAGGPGADRLDGGADDDTVTAGTGDDVLIGGDGRDRLFGQAGDDRLLGGTGDDMLAGGSGNDRLQGGSGANRMFGEAGNDRIVAGTGLNAIDGGSGNDVIEARNGRRDSIRCGTGRDRVRAERVDRLSGCESVDYTKKGAR